MAQLEISPSIADKLPPIVKQGLTKLSPEQQMTFEHEYKRRARNNVLFLVLAILFPIQHFLEGRVGLGILFILSFGGFWVWWLVDIFLVWGRCNRHNEDLATGILRDMKLAAA